MYPDADYEVPRRIGPPGPLLFVWALCLLALLIALCACVEEPPSVEIRDGRAPGEGWESIGVPSGVGRGVHRLEVPGIGWIVTSRDGTGIALVFVPDSGKAWK